MHKNDHKAIARLPMDPCGNDEYCSVCGDDNVVVVIYGKSTCHFCGNQVNLCSKCAGRMMREIKSINIGV
jgi:hypothetical protein